MSRVVSPKLEGLISHTLSEPVQGELRRLMFDLIEAGIASGLYCSLSGYMESEL